MTQHISCSRALCNSTPLHVGPARLSSTAQSYLARPDRAEVRHA